MAEPGLGQIGTVNWFDLTVEDAEEIRDFYKAVCGWQAKDHDMGDYADYSMKAESGDVVTGICHARGPNAKLPPVWLPYVLVDDIERVLETAQSKGGKVVDQRRFNGAGGLAVIQDPAGAHIAFWQKPPSSHA